MPHLDHDVLISLAANEPESAEHAVHAATCTVCRDELAALRHLVAIGPETKAVMDLPAPAPELFDRVIAEVRVAESLASPLPRTRAVTAQVPPDERAAPVPHASPTRSNPRVGQRRGRARWAGGSVAAVAAAVVAVAATLAIALQSRPVEIVTSAPLAPYGQTSQTAHGDADVLSGGQLRVQVANLPAVRGYYEVWLIDPATMEMFSVGVLTSGTSNAVMALPASVDLSRYRVVDVSAERYDNNPGHSGDSLVRGELP